MPSTKQTRWSQHVTETSDALDLEPGVFALEDPRAVARSLQRSAERSRRRKVDPFRARGREGSLRAEIGVCSGGFWSCPVPPECPPDFCP